jgi:hypothetical protein
MSDDTQSMPVPCCGNCPYFVATSPDQKTGICRESAPVPLVAGWRQTLEGQPPKPQILGYFPPTSANILCGKHPLFMAYYAEKVREAQAQAPSSPINGEAKDEGSAGFGEHTEPAGQA